MNCIEAEELITSLVDQAVPDTEVASLEAHLKICLSCQRLLQEERALKQAVRRMGERIRAPESLRAKIMSDPGVFDESNSATTWWSRLERPSLASYRPIVGGALVIVLLLSAFYFFTLEKEPIAVAAVDSYGSILTHAIAATGTATPEQIGEQLTLAVGGRFHPMGYDFSAMGLRPVSGIVRQIHGRKILLAIYKGAGGTIICYTFLGGEEDTPPHAARFFDSANKVNFYSFSRRSVNAVLHREGELICILAAEMPMDDLVALAKSKAKPS